MLGFICLALSVVCRTASGQESKEDRYLQIYSLIQQADTLTKNGDNDRAQAKYQQAQVALKDFQKTYPDWNAKVVAFRSNYLFQKLSPTSPTAAAGGSTAGGSAASGGTEVKLLEPGAEPRKVLRLHPNAGDKATLTLTMKMGMDMKMGEMENPQIKLPAMTMTMDFTVKSVSPEGDIAYDMVMTDAGIAEDPDVMPQVAEAMKKSMSGVKGMSGNVLISNRGITKSTQMKLPEGADPQMKQTMEQMKDSLSKISSPLPEEAVGVGAKWQSRTPIKSQGMTIDQTATNEITSIEEERVMTKVTLEQKAANQKMQNPSMPALKMDLNKMTGTGGGEVTFDLTKMVPVAANLQTHSELSMSMSNGGQKQPVSMKLDLNVSMESK